METSDCYLHGINELGNIRNKGVIEYVGTDFFVLRDKSKDRVYFVRKEDYWVIEEGDFY